MRAPHPASTGGRRRLAQDVFDALAGRIGDGSLSVGEKLPTESQLLAEFGVSRTVVREALSSLQAAGMVETRHGIGTFVLGKGRDKGFRIEARQLETIRDVIAVLELRIGVETEAAALAALRRTDGDLAAMRAALEDLARAIREGRDAVAADLRLHGAIARATGNAHFARLFSSLGTRLIPRARLDSGLPPGEQRAYLERINAEHESIVEAIAARDTDAARAAMRMHLTNSRERRRRAAEAAGE
jgi:DNA-binding FadR family transcriptional regulator